MDETTTGRKIVICGPNLHTRDATFHVHAPGCGDLKHYGRGGRRGGEDKGWEVEIESADIAFGASRAVYEDHISDYGYEYDSPDAIKYWHECANDFKIFPCVRKAVAA